MLPEWVTASSPLAALVAILIWLVRAVTSGTLVAGKQMSALLEAQQQLIRQQNEQIKALLNALQLTTKVVGSLPQPAGREEAAQ